jgi:hypothetical protein
MIYIKKFSVINGVTIKYSAQFHFIKIKFFISLIKGVFSDYFKNKWGKDMLDAGISAVHLCVNNLKSGKIFILQKLGEIKNAK